MHDPFDWNRILFNDLPAVFLLEVMFRSLIMFIVVLIALRLTGKRGVRQLSIFETVIIIALGSAAGDPMFYEDVGMLPALVVFVVITLMYRLVTWLTGVNKKFEKLIEGEPVCLIVEGKFAHESLKKEVLAQDEFFTELRVKNIEHVGQVRYAYLEPSGEISVYYYPNDEVKFGLPIRPQLFDTRSYIVYEDGIHACTFCGNVDEIEKGRATCKRCRHSQWVKAINDLRIT